MISVPVGFVIVTFPHLNAERSIGDWNIRVGKFKQRGPGVRLGCGCGPNLDRLHPACSRNIHAETRTASEGTGLFLRDLRASA